MSHLSRRTLVAGAASLPVAALPIAAQAQADPTPDPIFAAIEHFMVASNAHSAACKGEPSWRSPKHEEWSSAQGTACRAENDALWEMLQVCPTTKAGAVALINVYLRNYGESPSEAAVELLALIEQAIPHLV